MKTLAIIGFLLLSVLCIYFRATHIENDLTVRSREATQKANLPIPGLEFDGRDAILSGIVESEPIKDKIGQVISDVYGVRIVNNNLIIKKEQQPVLQNSMADNLQNILNMLVLDHRIEFTTASALLTESSKLILSEIAGLIKEHSVTSIEIIGHTDNLGKIDRNLLLSQKRAEAVKHYLIGQGVEASLLVALGRGSSEPVADNATSIGRRKNRRVEFKIVREM
jgi:OOP family OmpA-OmpF porin